MNKPDANTIQELLSRIETGQPQATEKLTEAVYEQLRTLADAHLRRRFGKTAPGLTWQPTVLVNETLLRLIKDPREFNGQGHFFAIATTAMKQVLIDYFRRRTAGKRGGGYIRVDLDLDAREAPVKETSPEDLEALFAALEQLAKAYPRKAQVVEMRSLWGLSNDEIAAALKISSSTIERDWNFARAWLKREMAGSETNLDD